MFFKRLKYKFFMFLNCYWHIKENIKHVGNY